MQVRSSSLCRTARTIESARSNLGSADWCHVWHADEAVANARTRRRSRLGGPAKHYQDRNRYSDRQVGVPDRRRRDWYRRSTSGWDSCASDADHDDELTWITGYTAAAGTFALEVPDPGDYRVSVELNACRAFYQHGGIVLEEDRASLLSIVDSNASGLRIQLSEGVCELQLSRVLIGCRGRPAGRRQRRPDRVDYGVR